MLTIARRDHLQHQLSGQHHRAHRLAKQIRRLAQIRQRLLCQADLDHGCILWQSPLYQFEVLLQTFAVLHDKLHQNARFAGLVAALDQRLDAQTVGHNRIAGGRQRCGAVTQQLRLVDEVLAGQQHRVHGVEKGDALLKVCGKYNQIKKKTFTQKKCIFILSVDEFSSSWLALSSSTTPSTIFSCAIISGIAAPALSSVSGVQLFRPYMN